MALRQDAEQSDSPAGDDDRSCRAPVDEASDEEDVPEEETSEEDPEEDSEDTE